LALWEAVRPSHSVGGAATMGHHGPFENGPRAAGATTLAEQARNPQPATRPSYRNTAYWRDVSPIGVGESVPGRRHETRRDETKEAFRTRSLWSDWLCAPPARQD